MDRETLIDKKEGLSLSGIQTQRKCRTAWRSLSFGFTFLVLLLFLSIALNLLFVFKETRHAFFLGKTRFGTQLLALKLLTLALLRCLMSASLKWDSVQPYYEETPYSEEGNDTLASKLWYGIDIDSGVIALSDDYVASQALSPAERFPWDPTKGIYIVHGYHNLHCLVHGIMIPGETLTVMD